MSNDTPPRAGDICPSCPNPDIFATRKGHFGRSVWSFECPQVIELYVKNSGIVIKCSGLDGPCCVEDNWDFFVSSPTLNPLKDFFEATLEYLRIK